MDPEAAFRHAILTEPDDHVHRLIYADWLLEKDPAREPLVRAQAVLGPSLRSPLGIKLVPLPAGAFLMGSPESEQDRDEDERQHPITISQAFYLAAYPVTVGQFRAFVRARGYRTAVERGDAEVAGWNATQGTWERRRGVSWRNPGWEQTDDDPAVCLDWADAVAFCAWLGEAEGREYRLPTEAEWEYACRAGTTTPFHFGVSLTAEQANYDSTQPYGRARKRSPGPGRTTPVGRYPANGFGLYDMHGNAWEWCADWYGPWYYEESSAADPQGPESGHGRVLRGGAWSTPARDCRSALRRCGHPWMSRYRDGACGFRVALSMPEPARKKTRKSPRRDRS